MAMTPSPPGRFSTTTGWPHIFVRRWAYRRAPISAPELGPSETMKCTGFCGHDCAAAPNEAASEMRATGMLMSVFNVRILLSLYSPRALHDCNTQSRNARPRQDGRADGAASYRQGIQRRR